MALSVPLSRFTSRVGGGSAFFVRHHSRVVKKNTAYAYLSIDEFFCPVDELTKRVGLQPTKAWQVGDIFPPVPVPRKFSAWHLKSRLSSSEEVERHVLDVLDQIRGREAVFRDLSREFCVRMQCVGYYSDYNPGFRLESDVVRRVAECGMMLDLDAYHLFDDTQETEDDHDA
jgi:hypothetical protein